MAKILYEKILTCAGTLHTTSTERFGDLFDNMMSALPDELVFYIATDSFDYEATVRMFITDAGVEYPVGIFKGPFTFSPLQVKWQMPAGRLPAALCNILRPSTVFSYFTDECAKAFSVDVEHRLIRYVGIWNV